MQNINIVTKDFGQWETKKEYLLAGIKSRTGNKDMFHCQERVTTLTSGLGSNALLLTPLLVTVTFLK